MLGSVRVTGPPFLIWASNSGMTLPWLPSTLPKRTATHFISVLPAKVWMSISQMRLVQPITLVGFTALSVESCTNRSTSCSLALTSRFLVPRTLFLTASAGLTSISGTCLCAAAWNTTVG